VLDTKWLSRLRRRLEGDSGGSKEPHWRHLTNTIDRPVRRRWYGLPPPLLWPLYFFACGYFLIHIKRRLRLPARNQKKNKRAEKEKLKISESVRLSPSTVDVNVYFRTIVPTHLTLLCRGRPFQQSLWLKLLCACAAHVMAAGECFRHVRSFVRECVRASETSSDRLRSISSYLFAAVSAL